MVKLTIKISHPNLVLELFFFFFEKIADEPGSSLGQHGEGAHQRRSKRTRFLGHDFLM